jgi:hypothetical protein
VLRNLLHSTVEEFLSVKNMQLCLNPSEIYKGWINKLGKFYNRIYFSGLANQNVLNLGEVFHFSFKL